MKAEQLRKSILQLAIQGKLVPQNPDDEPASVLLERIRAEKQRLIKQGKIKKDKGDSVIFKGDDNCYYEKCGSEVKNITDEIDFDLPSGWSFARINTLFYIQTGASFKKEQATNDSSQMRILRGGNIFQGEYQFLSNDIFIDSKLVQDSIILKSNDLITPAVTSIENIGKLARIEKDYDNVTAGGFVFIIRPCYNSDVFSKYMLYALQSSYFNKQLKSITKKSGQAFYNLGKERLIQLIVPIPPLDEQSRIIKAIEQFSPLIKDYDSLEQQATKLDDEIYDKLKKSILQYAIQGKLVPQNKNDEPASELLKRIQAEKKAQLGKKYVESYIFKGDDNCYYEHINGKNVDITEEIPFDLPNGWTWCRIGEFSKVLGGKRIPAGRRLTDKDTGYIYIKVSDMKNGTVSLEKLQYVPSDIYPSIARYIINKEDVYITVAGTIGRVGTIPPELDGANLTENADRLVFRFINQQWLVYCLQSQNTQEQIQDATTKVGQPKLAIVRIEQLLIPLPPLAEQKRIVDKIDEIFAKL